MMPETMKKQFIQRLVSQRPVEALDSSLPGSTAHGRGPRGVVR